MRKILLTTLFLFIFAHSVIAAPVNLRLNHQDAEALIQLERDTVAVIELETNPSTGYVWEADLPQNGPLKILGRQFESSNPGMLGSSGVEKVYVAGTSKGKASLDFVLKQTNGTQEALKQLKFRFQTQGALQESFDMPESDPASDGQRGIQVDAPENDLSAVSDDPSVGLPRAFNWCDYNGCTPIRNQGNCGSCWAFATVSVFESLIKIQDGESVDLSEQYLLSCNSDGFSCNGGWWAHDYHEWKYVRGEYEAGAVSEVTKPYRARDTSCRSPNDKVTRIYNWDYVSGQNSVPSTSALKEAIYYYGPVAAAVCVNSAFSYYSEGIFRGPSCNSVNHGINLVGWNDDGGYWILRNSWGRSWGENGYMRIKYGVSNVGFGASYVEYEGLSAFSTPETPDEDNGTDPSNPDEPDVPGCGSTYP